MSAVATPVPAPAALPTKAPDWTAQPIQREHLLTDLQMADFICDGYVLLTPEHRAGLNEAIAAKLDAMTVNPDDRIYDEVPELYEVYSHPMVRGALASLLGHDVQMNGHRHWHERGPNSTYSQGWHQDTVNSRHHSIKTVLAMYYPHDVTIDMGPTVVMPGTHWRNLPTDRMATYCNLRGQVPLTVKAGTIAITHYDLWHGGSVNRSPRMRHMLKFLFNRGSEPTAPSWNHDPVKGTRIAEQRFGHWPKPLSQSDHYKQKWLRKECWFWLLGRSHADWRRETKRFRKTFAAGLGPEDGLGNAAAGG